MLRQQVLLSLSTAGNDIDKLQQVVQLTRYVIGFTINDSGDTLLHYACQYNLQELTKIMIEEGFAVDIANEYTRDTPLHYATRAGNLQLIELLLASGADLNLRNTDNKTALDVATDMEHTEITHLLSTWPGHA